MAHVYIEGVFYAVCGEPYLHGPEPSLALPPHIEGINERM